MVGFVLEVPIGTRLAASTATYLPITGLTVKANQGGQMRRSLALSVTCVLILLVAAWQVKRTEANPSNTRTVQFSATPIDVIPTETFATRLPDVEPVYAEPEPAPEPAPEPVKTNVAVETPAPVPEPQPRVVMDSGECWGWLPVVEALWPPEEVAMACRIIGRESRGDETARNPSGASGLFQLMLPTHCARFERLGYSCSDWSNGVINADVAHDLWLDSGWAPWGF